MEFHTSQKEIERKEFAPLSFWAWNDEMSEERIQMQIEEFHKQGFRGFFMHSRGGLRTVCFFTSGSQLVDLQPRWHENIKWKHGFMMKMDGQVVLRVDESMI